MSVGNFNLVTGNVKMVMVIYQDSLVDFILKFRVLKGKHMK